MYSPSSVYFLPVFSLRNCALSLWSSSVSIFVSLLFHSILDLSTSLLSLSLSYFRQVGRGS